MQRDYYQWLKKGSDVTEDNSDVPCGKLFRGTKVMFKAFVPAGFIDSGWEYVTVFVRRMACRKEAIDAAILFSNCTEITQIDLSSVSLEPYFGTQDWTMAIYK
jgi:hypothetical protein